MQLPRGATSDGHWPAYNALVGTYLISFAFGTQLPRSVHGFEQLNVSRVILAAGNLTSPWAWVMRSVTTLLHPRYARNEQILVRKVARNAPPWGARGRPKRPERSNPGLWGADGGTYRRL